MSPSIAYTRTFSPITHSRNDGVVRSLRPLLGGDVVLEWIQTICNATTERTSDNTISDKSISGSCVLGSGDVEPTTAPFHPLTFGEIGGQSVLILSFLRGLFDLFFSVSFHP